MKPTSIREVITDKISGEWGDAAADNQGVIVIRTANFLNSGQINFANLIRRKIDPMIIRKKRLISGDIIIEKSGGSPTQPVGRVVIFQRPDNDTYLCNNFTSILRPNRSIVHPRYLFYVLHENHKRGKTLRYQNKTTGIINLKLDKYLDSEIPLPPLNDQKRIAHLLGKVESLIARRKQHIKQLDDLIKSVFLEMFGDPVRNEKGWETSPCSEIADLICGYPFKSDLYTDDRSQIPLCGGLIIYPDKIDWDKCNYWPKKLSAGMDRYRLNSGDIVLAMDRPWISSGLKICIIDSLGDNALLVQRTACIRAKSMSQIFLYQQFRDRAFTIHCKPTETTVPHISIKDLQTFKVICPPVNLQNQFATIVEKVEGIKSRYQQSLTDLENLYGALSQKAFKGELDLSRVVLPADPIGVESPVAAAEPAPITPSVIELPETDLMLPALENRLQLAPLLRFWLEAYCTQLGSAVFSLESFIAAAQSRLGELHPDNDFELRASDYEHVKVWVFEALDSGRLRQERNQVYCETETKEIVLGNLIELKANQR